MPSPLHDLPEIAGPSMAGKEETHNEANRLLEQGANWFTFKSRATTAEPGAPADGDCYIVPAAATGTDWAGQDGKIAQRISTSWIFLTPLEGMAGYVGDEDVAISYDGAAWNALGGSGGAVSYSITLALSDLTSDLTTGALKAYWDPPFPITISSVSASVAVAPTDAAILIDINEAGVSILSTVISIDATELRSVDSATPPVISDAIIAGRLTFDIDQIGSTVAGKGAQVTIGYTET